jgi:nucleotide-binding universal stress UspA family protein
MMAPAATLLVPLDGSANATAALSVARGLAHLKGATVMPIHVGREALAPDKLLGRMRLTAEDVRGLVIDQCTGSPAAAIVREAAARHAVLIVMCAPARPDGPLHPFGSVLADVLRTAPCPVVLVPSIRGRHPWALRQLVLPHDGTPTSAAAIAPTAELASRAGADLVVLHVATPGAERPTESGTFVAPRYLDHPQHEWPAWSREFLERVRDFGYPANIEKVRLVLAQGEASAAILEFARRNASDLIALAWRGSLEPQRAQTIRRVIRDASCPVIVFRVQA